MSNVLELTDVPVSSKGNERKSGQYPSKLRFTPASELSLVNNVKSGLIEKRVEKYNLRHSQQLDNNAVAPTAAVAATTTQPMIGAQPVDNNGVPVIDPNQQNVVPGGTVNNAAVPVAGDANAQAPVQAAPEAAQVVAEQTAQPVVPEAGQPVDQANVAAQTAQAVPDGSAPAITLAPLAETAQQQDAETPAVPVAVDPNQNPTAAVSQETQAVEQPVLSAEEEKKSREVLASSQIMKNASMTVNKLEGNFGTLGINYGVNVKPEGLVPKALSVPTAYRDKYTSIFKQVDIYKNLEDGNESLINVSKELANLNKEGQTGEESVQQVPEQVIPVAPTAATPVVPVVPIVPEIPGAQPEVKDGSQPAVSLALADFSNTASEEQQPAEQEVAQEAQPEPAANWKNLFDENQDTPTETNVEANVQPEATQEEVKPQKVKKRGLSAEELEQRKLIGNFGDQLKEVRNLKHSEDTPDEAGLLEKENSILGMMSSVVGGDKITEKTENEAPNYENNVEETTEYSEEQQPEETVEAQETVEESQEPYVDKFQGMFGKLNDDSAPAPQEEAPVEEVAEEQAYTEPVQEEQPVEQPVAEYSEAQNPIPEESNTNKFLGDFANEETAPEEVYEEQQAEQTNKFLGDFANEETAPEEVYEEQQVEQTNKFLGDFANEEAAPEETYTEEVEQASTGKFLGGFEQDEDNAPGKFLGDLNVEAEVAVQDKNYEDQSNFLGNVEETPVSEEQEAAPTEEYAEPVSEPEVSEEAVAEETPAVEEQPEVTVDNAAVDNNEDEEIAYLDPTGKELEPEEGLEKQDVNYNGRLIIDEKPVIDAIADGGLNEEIKGYAAATAQSLYEHNKKLDEMDEDNLPVRHKKVEAKSNLSQDLDNMDLVTAVRKHLTRAQSELVNTVNSKIEAIEGDLLAAVDQKIKQAEKQAEEANRSKEELEEQLRELVSREEKRKVEEQSDKKVKAKKKKKEVVEEDYDEDETEERVTVASKEDVEEVRKKLRTEMASEVNRQLDEAQLILSDAVDKKINSAKLELTAAVNTQVQNAQLELRGAINEQIENFKNEMAAPNEEIKNAQEELSRSVAQQVENAQLALSIAINKQVEEAQEKLESAKIELQGVTATQGEETPVVEETPQEEANQEEISQEDWAENKDDYPTVDDSSEEQKEVAATIASWINEDNDYIESNVQQTEEQQPEEPVEAEVPAEEILVEETPSEEAPVAEETQVEEPVAEEQLDESLPAPLEAQENVANVRKSHAPLVVEKLNEEPQEVPEEAQNVTEETTDEADNKELEQALEQVWLANDNEALKEQGKAPFIPFSIDRYSAETIENNDTGYNVVTASRPIKLHKKYIELLSSHLNGEGNKVVAVEETPSVQVPQEETQVSANETIELPVVAEKPAEENVVVEAPVEENTVAEVPTEENTVAEAAPQRIAEEQQLGMEILPLKNRYCNVVSTSRPIKVPKNRKDNIVQRLTPKQESQVQSKKDLLNSLKDELNSGEFDFMRYDNAQEEEKKIA